MYRICIIEDDEIQCRELKRMLENSLYQALVPEVSGREGAGLEEYLLEEIQTGGPDLILLDIELPGLDGVALCRRIREFSEVPVIFVTGRAGAMDELNGILAGGDDYISKPYCAPVVLARIAAVLKRTAGKAEERCVFTYGGYELNILNGTISREGRSEELTRTELRICRLLFARAGQIVSREELLDDLWDGQIFVFQDFNLLDTLTIGENISLALALTGKSRAEIRRQTAEIMDRMGISELRDKFPFQVSGGQKQRCACARALIKRPKIIFADEPTGALDSHSARTLLETFTEMNREMNATILMVTHDAFSASYCSRILFLKDGRIFQELQRGRRSRREFLNEILDVLSLTGGDDHAL